MDEYLQSLLFQSIKYLFLLINEINKLYKLILKNKSKIDSDDLFLNEIFFINDT
jgi:hypothetical protein